ncbi:MAG TPA: hypothetical protein PLA07_03935 [Sulfuricurvum sp.]|nr:hypothetical protein [Sulfuricurvum sp.]
MKKQLLIGMITSGLLCESSFGNSLSDSTTLGYAYLSQGKTLSKVSMNRENLANDMEIIRITKDGFYPDYQIPTNAQDCGKIFVNGSYVDYSQSNFCKSNFSKRHVVGMVATGLINSIMTPLGALVQQKAIYMDGKSFDNETFMEVVKNNNLEKYREKLLEIFNYADVKKTSIDN